jgi:DNA-binding transcriptional ArsR family regulator
MNVDMAVAPAASKAVGGWRLIMEDDQNQERGLSMENHGLTDGDLASLAFLGKSLSDENRLRILLCLGGGKKAVGSIVEELNLSQPLVSHHLKELKRSLLVNIERSGPFIFYRLADPSIIEVMQNLSAIARNLLARRTSL